jgi:hypothetical protein
LAEKHFRFPQFADDLFDGIAFSRNFTVSPFPNPAINVGSFFRGQVRKQPQNIKYSPGV